MKALLCALALTTTFVLPGSADAGKKKKHNVWNLNIKFVIGTDTWDTQRDDLEKWLRTQVATAEKMFADKPRLKINYVLERKTKVVGTISNRGKSSVNAAETPLGRYTRQVVSTVEKNWHRATKPMSPWSIPLACPLGRSVSCNNIRRCTTCRRVA